MALSKQILGFALGSVWRWAQSENRNGLLGPLKRLDIAGVELTFSDPEALQRFRLSKQNTEWLKSLPYVSIHAPFNLFSLEKKKDILAHLQIVSTLYRQTGAQNVVVHPTRSDSIKLLEEFDFSISIENMHPKDGFDIPALSSIFSTYPEYRLCLDVSHAYLWSPRETGHLIRTFRDRISQIHLSGTYRKKCHQSLTIVTKTFMESIKELKTLNVPLIVEEDFQTKNIEHVRKELRFIADLFSENLHGVGSENPR